MVRYRLMLSMSEASGVKGDTEEESQEKDSKNWRSFDTPKYFNDKLHLEYDEITRQTETGTSSPRIDTTVQQ
ncbi:unnamed protein product [Parnassius apollo]|uniref:(apollo) hypothetical protein n=1 Tax=Parnassius apollo TaxID=110799 RepID=A0A8S3XX63_PARAO|nr:unnamed protein product [Parnassius apollo]